MKALLVIDVQNVIVQFKDFSKELNKIETIINDFKTNDDPIIFIRNISIVKKDPFHVESKSSKIYEPFESYADYTVNKTTPSSFFQTELDELLHQLTVTELMITGFNTEFCCLFTSIAAFDRGYDVTVVEDATGTVNDDETYEMPGLDIRDFIGTALHWSNTVKVLEFEEYKEEQRKKA